MRKIAGGLLLLFAFTIPWEYSLDFGEPVGNIARVTGLILLLAAIPAVCQAGRLRPPGPTQWLALAFYLWICCTGFWSIDPAATVVKLRAFFQEIMTVWLVWEFTESARDLRALLRAYVAGSWVLAALTIANLLSSAATEQTRFAAFGQDPNDVARFLDLGFPLAALLLSGERGWAGRLLAAGYFPLGVAGVLLTASRGGFLAALVGLAGGAWLLARIYPRKALAASLLLLLLIAGGLWWAVPQADFERLATISEQLRGGDLNQRLNIWTAGWDALARAPWIGTGVGTFVSAAGLAPEDTAHNTALSVAVAGGACALLLASAIMGSAVWALKRTQGAVRWAMATSLLVWSVTSLVATVEESRTTWLLLAMISVAGRLAREEPETLAGLFSPFFSQDSSPRMGGRALPAGA